MPESMPPGTLAAATSRALPRPPSWPWVGNLPQLFRGANGCLYDALAQLVPRYGPVFGLRLFGRDWCVAASRDSMQEALVTRRGDFAKGATLNELRAMNDAVDGLNESDGQRWQRQRRTLQPAFGPQAIAAAMPRINFWTSRALRLLEDVSEIEMLSFANRWAQAVVSDFSFGYQSQALDSLKKRDALLQRQEFFTRELMKRYQRTPLWKYLPLPGNALVWRRRRGHKRQLAGLLKQRRAAIAAGGEAPRDALALLLASADDDGAPLRDDELIMQMHTIIGAGTETTASALHWLCYFLARTPAVQERLAQEVGDFFRDEITAPDLEAMPYLRAVVRETLRLRTPIPVIFREAVNAVEIAGFRVKAGSFFVGLLQHVHVDPAIWGETAADFDPDRFLDARWTKLTEASYSPYGVGPRRCVGDLLATAQLSVFAARLVAKFRIELAPGQSIAPILRFSLKSTHGIRVRLTKRERPGPQI